MLRVGALDVRACRVGACRIQTHGHDLDALGMELAAEGLPPGQVVGAASIG